MYPQNVLMVKPIGFRVDYAINPYMKDAAGRLQQVNTQRAFEQWESLKSSMESLGAQVQVLEGKEEFPDMVFCANQTLPFISKQGRKSILLSRMKSEYRRGEVPYFKSWAMEQGFDVFEMTDFGFEGCGDAVWNYETGVLYGGYGFRTQIKAYDWIQKLIDEPIVRLELVDPCFYHLDTCFSVLDKNTVAIVKEAFTEKSLRLIESRFENIVRVNRTEATQFFAANCLSLNGKDILVPAGPRDFINELSSRGFQVHQVETGEYIKSGGSIFCMKQVLF